jgi:predicted nucleic acid-binding protein
MSSLYLDSCCIIYLIESANPFHNTIVNRLRTHGLTSNAAIATSRLARLECRTKPLRDKNDSLLARYDAFFSAQRFRLIDISPAIVECATQLRASYGFKTPDALHLASAIVEKVDIVLTGDKDLEKCRDVPIEVIV